MKFGPEILFNWAASWSIRRHHIHLALAEIHAPQTADSVSLKI